MTQATLGGESNACEPALYMALELSDRSWKVLFQAPSGRRRERFVAAGELEQLLSEMAAAKRKLGLPPQARVVSCYEAGRDGFWLHRALVAHGVESLVVDSSSIEVPQRARRRKTDRLDLGKLMALLVRYLGGERGVWSVVRVPDAEVEDVRQLSRGIDRLKSGLSMLIFPEGTRSLDGALLPFRPGPFTMAIEAQAPVVPFTILGTRHVMPKGQTAILPGRVTLLFHPPIPTAGLSQDDREALMRQTKEAIAAGLGS